MSPQASPFGGGGGGGLPPLHGEFAKLREDVQKKDSPPRLPGERKVAREEM